MAGFRPAPKRYKLTFDDSEDLKGLEVTMGTVTLGEYNEMMRAGLMAGVTAEVLDANEHLLDIFADRIVAWNLLDVKGKPVPRTPEAVRGQERHIITAIIGAWQLRLVGVDPTSNGTSSSGVTTLEESLDLGSLSESPGS